jgi:hypothetical protein
MVKISIDEYIKSYENEEIEKKRENLVVKQYYRKFIEKAFENYNVKIKKSNENDSYILEIEIYKNAFLGIKEETVLNIVSEILQEILSCKSIEIIHTISAYSTPQTDCRLIYRLLY